MSTFMDYFQGAEEYPRIHSKVEILPIGTMWQYVSSSFLNGFVNVCSENPPIKAFVLGRYTAADEKIYENDDYRPSIQEPPGLLKLKKIDASLTKRQVFEVVTEPGRLFHTKLSILSDDVLALFYHKLDDGRDCYWFFWFDQDVSDCGIGRFVTDDPQADVIAKFDAYVAERSAAIVCEHEPWLLPAHFFTGWMEF